VVQNPGQDGGERPTAYTTGRRGSVPGGDCTCSECSGGAEERILGLARGEDTKKCREKSLQPAIDESEDSSTSFYERVFSDFKRRGVPVGWQVSDYAKVRKRWPWLCEARGSKRLFLGMHPRGTVDDPSKGVVL